METTPVTRATDSPGSVQGFRLLVAEGPGAGTTWRSQGDRCSIGSHESNDLVIADATVSRFHCEIRLVEQGANLRDLDSRNGTILDGVRVSNAFLRSGSTLRIGESGVVFELSSDSVSIPISSREKLGSLVGRSAPMRRTFALLERAAATDATVLLEGETGTGKEGAAQALHAEGKRSAGPFVTVDCSAIPESLIESELFGHHRGAFTGAVESRVGAFAEADGGTIFLDEVGELPLEMQPKLLRVLERREVRAVGTNQARKVDVRVVAATNRDLRAEVNAGRFRPDLYFRMAVVRIPMPALRSRPDDLPLLVNALLDQLGAGAEAAPLRDPRAIARLQTGAWPGNVRELRNHLERCLVFQQPMPERDGPSVGEEEVWKYDEARRRALQEFEQRYLAALLERHGGSVAAAAQEAGVARVSLYRMLRRSSREE